MENCVLLVVAMAKANFPQTTYFHPGQLLGCTGKLFQGEPQHGQSVHHSQPLLVMLILLQGTF